MVAIRNVAMNAHDGTSYLYHDTAIAFEMACAMMKSSQPTPMSVDTHECSISHMKCTILSMP